MTIVVDWNGNDLPEALRSAPRGRYALVPMHQEEELSPEQEQGLTSALASARDRGTILGAEARRVIDGLLGR